MFGRPKTAHGRIGVRNATPAHRTGRMVSRLIEQLQRLLETHPRYVYPACAGIHRDLGKKRI